MTAPAATAQTVSDILELRSATEGGFPRIVTGSLIVHIVGVATLFLVHQFVATHPRPKPVIMTISLGSGTGPKSTGTNSAGARPVDQVAEPKKNEVVKPAASTSSTMTLPVKSTPKPAKIEESLPVTSTPRPATTGREVTKGTSLAETGSKTQETGLSIGGKGVQVDGIQNLTDFCCVDYLNTIVDRIRQAWKPDSIGGRGYAVLKFTVNRDGSLSGIVTEESSGAPYENQSRSALLLARIPPWPPELKNNTLVIHLRFPYGMD